MNFRELRNRLISSLWDYIGCPVILSNQVQPEAEPPFCIYTVTGSAVNGEDEAWAVADKAISYFKHAGQDDFLALGVAVVDVGQAQDRTTLLVDEAARRVGFDVQIRYTRIDERETASIEKIKI